MVFLGGEEVEEGSMGILLLLKMEEEMERRMAVEFGEGVVEFGWTKEARGGALSWWLLCWRLQEKKKKRNERERERVGIYMQGK